MEDVLEKKVGDYIKLIAIAVFAILFLYVIYDNHTSKEQIRASTKTKDSLEALIQKYEFDYVALKIGQINWINLSLSSFSGSLFVFFSFEI